MDKKQKKIKFITLKKIILFVANIIAIFLLAFCGLMYNLAHEIFPFIIIGETIFLIMSLIVYYLSVIADAVGKMAKQSKENDDE